MFDHQPLTALELLDFFWCGLWKSSELIVWFGHGEKYSEEYAQVFESGKCIIISNDHDYYFIYGNFF